MAEKNYTYAEISMALDCILRVAGNSLGAAQSDVSEYKRPFEIVETLQKAASTAARKEVT